MESFFEAPTGHKGILRCLTVTPNFQLPVLRLRNLQCLYPTKTPALQQHQRCVAVGSKHSAKPVLAVPASHALGKVLRWMPWRRHGDGSAIVAIPMEQTREEHTHPVVPSSGTHMQQVLSAGCSMALPCCTAPWTLARSQKRGTDLVLIQPPRPKGELCGIRD